MEAEWENTLEDKKKKTRKNNGHMYIVLKKMQFVGNFLARQWGKLYVNV